MTISITSIINNFMFNPKFVAIYFVIYIMNVCEKFGWLMIDFGTLICHGGVFYTSLSFVWFAKEEEMKRKKIWFLLLWPLTREIDIKILGI